MQLIRYQSTAGAVAVALASENRLIAHLSPPELPLHELLRMPLDSLRRYIEQAIRLTVYREEKFEGAIRHVLAPLDGATEVWGAGMTYKRSGKAKHGESSSSDLLFTRLQGQTTGTFL